MLSKNLFNLLDNWVERGWLRELDRAFTCFLHDQQPDTPELVLLAAALTSHQLGRGHICLDLQAALANPDAFLSLPEEGKGSEQQPDMPTELLMGVSRQTWQQALQNSALVSAGSGNTPLVLYDGRLYLRRYWQYTQQTAQSILQRLKHQLPTPDNLSERLDQLFMDLRSPEEQAKTEVHLQSVATAMAAKSAFSVISGGPGTGKTTTIVQLLRLLQGWAMEQGRKLRIRLAAPTGKAAARLTESIGDAVANLPENSRREIPTEVTTLHRLMGSRPDTRHFIHNPQNPLHVDLLVIDEASMIDLEMMAALLGALPIHAQLILLGDKDQLASVEAGSVLGDICRNADRPGYQPETIAWLEKNTGYCLKAFAGLGTELDQHICILRKSHRFGVHSGIGVLSQAINAGDSKEVAAAWGQGFNDITRLALQTTDDKSFACLVLDGNSRTGTHVGFSDESVGYRKYLQRVGAGPQENEFEEDWLRAVLDDFSHFQLLAALRKGPWGVEGLNEKIADILYKAGLIRAKEGWYPGRPVLVSRNDYSLGLMNGDIGIALPIMDHHNEGRKVLRVVFPMPNGALKIVLPSRLNDVETVYALTVHKSQGSEFEHVALVLPERMSPVLTRELIYTGITRARSRFTLVSLNTDVLMESVKRRTHRASGLGDLLS
ncbi:MAG: exodeoxyribonuclease V subunit alpha [Desulfobacterales bacterium]|nr:exodeoxyribonuclease V subunit alpha [Desulfobacterales bacterium]